ncbi:MAG: hypothetical protein ACQEQ4_08715 [Fibrobacterota bacterium]
MSLITGKFLFLLSTIVLSASAAEFGRNISFDSNEILQSGHVLFEGRDSHFVMNDAGTFIFTAPDSLFTGIRDLAFFEYTLEPARWGLDSALPPAAWVPNPFSKGDSIHSIQQYYDDSLSVVCIPRTDWDESFTLSFPTKDSREMRFGKNSAAVDSGVFIPLNFNGILFADYSGDSLLQLRPGDEAIELFSQEGALDLDSLDAEQSVISLVADSDSLFAVTGAENLWVYDRENARWEERIPRQGYSLVDVKRSGSGQKAFWAYRTPEDDEQAVDSFFILHESSPGEYAAHHVAALLDFDYIFGDTLIVFAETEKNRIRIYDDAMNSVPSQSLSRSMSRAIDTLFVASDPTIYGITVSPRETGAALSIATDAGVLYTDYFDSARDVPDFRLFRRDRPVEGDLREIYAEPSILNNRYENAVFVYSLKNDSRVTIDIFDANLDYVCRIVDNEQRSAGGTTHSTNRVRDTWDGTHRNDGKETVSPGVYYFRITTNRGDTAFGKVVVAKN